MVFWLVAALAAFLMGLSKGGVPMIALLSVPLMSLYMEPAIAAGLLLPIYIVADLYAVYLFRKSFSAKNLKIMLPGAAAGIAVGFGSVNFVPGDFVKLLVATIGLVFLASALKSRLSKTEIPPRPADVPRGRMWGALAGFTSYISHAGGPPFQAYVLPQKLEKMTYLGTTTIFFAVVNLLKVPPYILAGQITSQSTLQIAMVAPVALFGAWVGINISRRIPDQIFFVIVEVALAVVSLKLLYDVFA
ncbi:sulfite exporter TauE/SafE family protein [Cognatishimia maritima]|uniref:Probable membrane transporter protein n=1 Tax=Cognatishimia maritima TaxID=870908 RepID=A0A1M5T2V8_9RHOB|nr:sulfite exporter TauE/SafE family protein [Cognatishimia maritima]SHH45099.1 hypothetical protein SAMN04488044_2567 [Cognatishimia maritima]